ncbi:FtsX-like permease family protein [Streptomyces sp. NPDC048340]|uniref:ABC transporter permease n=1 Tax=Streptomyces sp. NPDC048340 TaxID=3365537 RepID=UPI0037163CF1
MLTLALATLRTRWSAFAGSFLALSLGVALTGVMGLVLASSLDAPQPQPERFAAAPVVVQGADTFPVATGRGPKTGRLDRPHPLPPELIGQLRQLGPVTEDRAFPVRARGGPADLVGHPWSTAPFARYELQQGRAPLADDEAVATGSWAAPGQRLETDRGTVRIVGTVRGLGFEHAVFYTDARAAQLAPRSERVVVDAAAERVREVVRQSERAQVLTGDDRRLADADPDRDGQALMALNALFGTAGGVTAFVSVFVVASTFSFAVAQRRREFGLLRTAGATPRQLRRMVNAEAAAVGVLASATGCLLAAHAAPRLASWTVRERLAPAWFALGEHTWPYHLAFWTGLSTALLGAAAASWRAGRTAPVQALREASVDSRVMTPGRWAAGGALLLTALVTLLLALADDPGDLLHRKTYMTRPLLLITACALLTPLLVRPLARLLAWLPSRLPGALGMLVRESAAAGVRRTAAVAAPVLVTVALAGSLLGTTATINAAKAEELRTRTLADFIVTPPAGGLPDEQLRRLRELPGAVVSPSAAGTVYAVEDGIAPVRSEVRAAEPSLLAATVRLPLVAGDLRDLDDDSIVVNQEWQQHTVGARVPVWLPDGTPRTLRIAAVLRTGTGGNGAYVTPRNAVGAPVDRIDVRGGSLAALRAAAPSAEVSTRAQWLRAAAPDTKRTTRLGLLLTLGIALLYSAVAVANTLVMAARDRLPDLAALRLAGATKPQLLRLVTGETLLVVAIGTTAGLLTTGLNLAGLGVALALLGLPALPVVPWAALGAVAAACTVIALPAALIPAARALRHGATAA